MFDWKDQYSVNNVDIDAQHRRLFELVAQLYDIVAIDDGVDHYDEIKDIFDALTNYTVYHFGYEEQLMQQQGYDAKLFKIHKLEHDAFVRKMGKVQAEDLDKKQKQIIMDVIMFAADWIEKHILATDQQYKPLFS